MKKLIALLSFAVLAVPAFAQDKAKKELSEKQKAQQERMKDCNAKMGDKKGEDRKKAMSSCRAPLYSVPDPAIMIGVLAAPSRCTISLIKAGSGLARSTGYGSTRGMSAVSSSISRGSDTTTGPGRPLRAR